MIVKYRNIINISSQSLDGHDSVIYEYFVDSYSNILHKYFL